MPFLENEQNGICAICLDTVGPSGTDTLYQLPKNERGDCGHGGPDNPLHWDCLQRSITANGPACPICKIPIPEQDKAELQTAENLQELGLAPVGLTQGVDQQEIDELNAQIEQLVQQQDGQEQQEGEEGQEGGH